MECSLVKQCSIHHRSLFFLLSFFFFQADDGIRDRDVTGVQTCALPIWMAGRLDAMEPEDFIFRVESDSAKRLLEARGRSHANRPLSPQEVNRALRKYCRRAGIEAAAVHVHSLRHSANMLYAELGVPVERRSFLLNHSSLDMTMRYTHEMEGQRNVDWALASEALGL